jgi:hypothetical protein
MEATTMDTIYEVLRAEGIPIDHHSSDLYVKVTEQSRQIVNAYYHRGDIKSMATFKSDIDGSMWFDIPFAYDPWWTTGEVNA